VFTLLRHTADLENALCLIFVQLWALMAGVIYPADDWTYNSLSNRLARYI